MLTVRNLFILSILSLCFQTIGQTLIINEFSNGPSGSQEYVELVVVDTSSDNSNCSNCIDIRGWIIDDNNGFHGSSGIASGCNRFSNDVFWSCIPLGTSITVYNGTDPNIDLPVNDLDINDGNCNLVLPIENSTLFETNPNTPGAIVCDYPNIGWSPGGIWSRIGMRNGGDCIRLVDLTGCEVFSLSYGDISLNSTIYFPGSGTDNVFYFSGTNPYLQADWTQGCAGDPGACLGNDQSPGAANSNLNSDYIDQFTVNGCLPSIPISLILTNQSNSCGDCTGSITLNAAQGQGLYTFNINPAVPITSNPSTSTISVDNICSGEYIATVIDENGCEDAQNFEIENDDPPTITTSNNVSVCNGGSIELNAILGGSANAISWVSPNGTFSNINSTTTTFTPSINSAIAFVVVTAESENCGTTQENIFVNVTSPIEPIFSQLPAQCEGAAFSLNTTSANGISGTWSPAIDNLATTSYTFTPNIGECATIQNMTVVVNTTSSSISNLTICDNDLPFIWNGLTFSENDTQSTTLTSNNTGCDSIVTLNLSVNPTSSIIEELTICQSELPYLWNGITFANSGSQTASLFTANGCDSIVTLNLTVISEFTGLETHTGCIGDGYSIDVNGTIYDEANPTGTEILLSSEGCDSTIVVNLTFNNNVIGNETYTGCLGDGYSVIVNGNTYDESNSSGTETLTNIFGCDSIVTIDLTFNNPSISSEIYTGCSGDGYSIDVNGTIYDETNPSGIETLSNAFGCDSTVTIDLTFNSVNNGLETYTGCSGDGYTVVINGTTYNEFNPSGTETLSNAFGCDSTVTIDLTFNNVNNGLETYTGCSGDGYSVIVNSVTYDESNPTGTEIMSNIFGCDSIITIDLTFNSPSTGSEVHVGCNGDGYTVTVNGNIYNEANPSGIETLNNINGCDSVVTITLTFNSSITGNENYIGCVGDGYSVDVNGTIYDEANPTGTETLTAVAGCDSIVSINLIFNSVLPGTDVQSACDSYTWIDGNTYNSSNNDAMWVIPSVSGCDSIITLELTITNSNSGTDIKSACDTYTWIDGNTYTTSNNNATWVLTNIEGCDSLVTLDLTINDSPTLIDFSNGGTYCEGESVLSLTAEVSGVPDFTLDYTLNGNPLSISSNNSSIDLGNLSGVYTLNALNDNYCTTSLNESQTIVINPIPDAPSMSEDENYCSNTVPEAIQPEGGSGSYNWYFDASLTQLLATATEYTPSLILGSSTYYVTAIENNCEGLPGEISITFADCQIIIPTAFTPDDDQANDKWMLGNIDNLFPKNVVSIYNRWGNKLFESREGIYSANPWNGTYNNEKLPIASYYYIIEFNDGKTAPINGIVSIVK